MASLGVLLVAVVATVLLLGAHHRAGVVAAQRPVPPGRGAGKATSASVPATAVTSPPSTTTSSTSTTTTTTLPPRPTGVGLARCTFVDTTRTTFDYATGATLPSRTLLTEIRYPTASTGGTDGAGEVLGATPFPRTGGYPTIFFAPGYDVTPDVYAPLLDTWVRAGFVVVAPSFPDTNPTAVAAARVGDAEDDVVNQPGDLAFVIRSSLSASEGTAPGCAVLHGLVAPGQVGVAGQSDGGDTVAMFSYATAGSGSGAGAGLPVRAAAVLSGSEWAGATYGAPVGAPPLLVVQSATDRCNPPQQSVQLYDAVPLADKWFLALSDADHLGPYDGEDATAFQDVAAVTTRFFRLELGGTTPTVAALTNGETLPGATLTTGPAAPALPDLAFSKPACAPPGAA